jgi:hypothetical protein
LIRLVNGLETDHRIARLVTYSFAEVHMFR